MPAHVRALRRVAGFLVAAVGVAATIAMPAAAGPPADSGVDARTRALAGQLLPGRNLLTSKRVMRDPPGDGTHVVRVINMSWKRDFSFVLERALGAATNLRQAATPAPLEPDPLAQAARIRADIDARYRRPRGVRLAVTDASSTGVIDSFTLFTGRVEEPRVVPAANGIYYAVCPVGAACPCPGRAAQPPAAFLPRRAGLELAVRTFLETSADVVAVSLPTRRCVLLILERADVIGTVDALALHAALRADPAAVPALSLRRVVDEITLPHLFAPLALVPVSDTRETLVASSLFR